MKLLQLPNIGNGGRLGNHLFTIASTIGLALRHGYTPRFPADWKYRNRFNIPDEWFGEIVRAKSATELKYEHDAGLESCVKFNGGILSIFGYLQSPKYWQGYETEIRKYLTPKEAKPETINKVAIHYRRDDYVGNPNYKQIDVAYYLQQYTRFFDGLPIHAFSDDPDFIRLHHSGDCSHDNDPVSELAHMASYRYHITANSTFSWWGAYLSGGFTVHPDDWFDGPLLKHTIRDLFPQSWRLRQEGKCYLNDVTFIIPVMYDSHERSQNLDLVIAFINHHFYTNILVGEINTCQFANANIRFDFGGKFHRTKALNELTRMAKTPYVVNLDCDVIIPPFQILKMVMALRGGADVVYPYDGTFACIERKHYPAIKADLNLPALRGEKWRGFGHKERFISVGGCVGYEVGAFFDAGGENENFISYAPEDQERFWRFKLLGLDVQRIDGALYHIDHYRGADSTMNNPDSRASHKYWDSIKHFTKKQLKEHLGL